MGSAACCLLLGGPRLQEFFCSGTRVYAFFVAVIVRVPLVVAVAVVVLAVVDLVVVGVAGGADGSRPYVVVGDVLAGIVAGFL